MPPTGQTHQPASVEQAKILLRRADVELETFESDRKRYGLALSESAHMLK
jgi:hypothetical protein